MQAAGHSSTQEDVSQLNIDKNVSALFFALNLQLTWDQLATNLESKKCWFWLILAGVSSPTGIQSEANLKQTWN